MYHSKSDAVLYWS